MTTAMDVFVVTEIMQALWLYLAAPLLLLAGIVFTVQLRAPQFRRLPDAFRALRRSALSGPAGGDGMVAPGLSAALISAGQLGAATAVATATAVALGGPGALLYLWLFFLLVAPLRYAESWLAGTDAPGRGERAESLSLARRAMREKRWRFLGVLVTLSVAVSALAYGGVIQAEAMADSVSPLLPGAGVALVLGAAAAGTLLAIAGRSTAAIAGYHGRFGLAAFLIWILWAIGSAPGSAFAALGASFGAVFEGATRFEAFGGAFAGEVALAAMLHALPAFSAPTGADGAAQTLSTAPVRRQSAIALLPPFAMAVLGTLLCMALVGTGAYGERVETTMRLPEGQVFKVPANTAAERLEADRLFSGYIRTRAGEARNPAISYGTG
ncbi:MAG: alanine:cation symporter family protein, partial [Myxococcota bacterium]